MFKTGVGIVATKWLTETPMIFKNQASRAHGRAGTFTPGFGCSIADAVEASCSAYPFFERKTVHTAAGMDIELVDGGYCANNPTLYAIADGLGPLGRAESELRVVNVGVGIYPEPKPSFKMRVLKRLKSVQLLQKTLEINTQSMEQLRGALFKTLPHVRISEKFERPEMATDLFESDQAKLNMIRQLGSESFAKVEGKLRELMS